MLFRGGSHNGHPLRASAVMSILLPSRSGKITIRRNSGRKGPLKSARTFALAVLLVSSVCQTATLTVTSELDTNDPKSASLRRAIYAANTVGGNNTIILTNNIYKLTISGSNEDAAASGDLDITRGNLTIIGLSPSNVIVTAAGLCDRGFHLLPGAQFSLLNLFITRGI